VTLTRLRFGLSLLACGILLFAAGCGGSKPTKVVVPKDGLPAGTPINDSDAHLIARFEATFEAQSGVEYAKLLTDDFVFHFSSASDPDLVLAYGENWGRDDETAAISNLFVGFDAQSGQHIPGASIIQMDLYSVQTENDLGHVDSVAFYRKIIVTRLVMAIEIPGTPDPTTYNIDSRQELYVVRGDAAVLAAGQAAQSDRWYIRRWDDLSPPPSGGAGKWPTTNALTPKTLGSLKSQYRQ
jgi:hypothetical protein